MWDVLASDGAVDCGDGYGDMEVDVRHWFPGSSFTDGPGLGSLDLFGIVCHA